MTPATPKRRWRRPKKWTFESACKVARDRHSVNPKGAERLLLWAVRRA